MFQLYICGVRLFCSWCGLKASKSRVRFAVCILYYLSNMNGVTTLLTFRCSLSLSPPLTTVCVCVFVRVRPCITSIHNSASEDTVDMCVVFMECVNMC